MNITSSRRALMALAVAAALPRVARAQAAWPDRPTRLIVPFGAGGAVDTLSRTVANLFGPHANGQTLVVENRGGAGGGIAGQATATARPDGTTLMMADLGANAIGRELQPSLSYDPMRAFTPICHLVNLPIVLVVKASLPVDDLAGFIAYAKAQRQPMPFAHPGIGHASHLAQELLIRRAELQMTPVPYRSGAEVMRSLIQGETDSGFPTVSTALPFIRDNRVKAIAVGSLGPVALLPNIPTVASLYPGFEANVWHGIVGPAGLAPEIVATANRIFNAIAAMPEFRRQVESTQAAQVVGGTPEAFAQYIQADYDRWVPLIRAGGMRAE
ncbi:Bug family tripartite tricarboxylate transporter substrate binding protein [Plastoroseomonas arctica]|uniref:Tripartite tricarboxylate transporter substrate binding protein n=1 Tax=Plastoroseomonas arctica TaxID=1509237 RepID=A0AAF1KPX9_9PROT|nr:tripartite tricarboxylate transporter substrate-binding protein [Plastoroseomonas arctica]MBR0656698.1 tripartite tricarboxylate transporter substrate binding protein [Plastoroseomonas arctica]